MARFAPRYASIAQKIVSHSYSIAVQSTLEVRELLELAGDEQEIDHILCDDKTKQAGRLAQLDRALDQVLSDYAVRRLRSPLTPASSEPGLKSYVAAFASPVAARDDQTVRLDRFRATPVVRGLLYELSPDDFEVLSGVVLKIIGCTNISVTQSSKDDGVDAIAELPMRRALQSQTPLHRVVGLLSFLVYVQAKRYSEDNPVKQEAVQQLQGSWISVRNAFHDGNLSSDRAAALRTADYKSADPVLLVIMTTGSFTAGALTKASNLGVITLDGEQMAQLLIEAEAFEKEIPDGQALADVLRRFTAVSL